MVNITLSNYINKQVRFDNIAAYAFHVSVHVCVFWAFPKGSERLIFCDNLHIYEYILFIFWKSQYFCPPQIKHTFEVNSMYASGTCTLFNQILIIKHFSLILQFIWWKNISDIFKITKCLFIKISITYYLLRISYYSFIFDFLRDRIFMHLSIYVFFIDMLDTTVACIH